MLGFSGGRVFLPMGVRSCSHRDDGGSRNEEGGEGRRCLGLRDVLRARGMSHETKSRGFMLRLTRLHAMVHDMHC